ncbi:F0F1 ATP synthase subunit B [Kitasatospora sp. NPDC089797]|uniref:F0F1 ATP synthase subunit B family protein n=1 Tax=Kitasatospora sp. NPDC089797 TaxID=3155298 RepID=UPI00341E85AF
MHIELGPLRPDPGMLVLGLALFLLLLWTLGTRLLPRVERVQAERRDATEGRAERAEAVRAEAEAVREAVRRELAEARHEAARIRRDHAERGAAAIAAARADGTRDRERLLAAGRTRIAADRDAAAAVLRQDVGELAVLLAGRVVGEPVHTVAAERRTVQRFFTAE